MIKYIKNSFNAVVIIFLISLTACSQKVQISAIKPAQIDKIAQYKKIAIDNFSNDYIGFANKLESKLSKVQVDSRFFFTVIGRRDIDKVLKEQRLQLSGLLDKLRVVKIGKLLGAQAIISGSVSDSSMIDTRHYEERTKCEDKKCKKTYIYNVSCTKRTISMSVELKIISIEDGSIIYGDILSKSKSWDHCLDRSSTLPSKQYGLNLLADTLSGDFVRQMAPYYTYYNVELLDTPEIDYTDEQEELLEHSLTYIEHSRYEKAQKLLSKLLDSTSDSCYVAAYNLGLIKERDGKLKEAQQLYMLADSLMIEPNSVVDNAIIRIKSSINARKQAKEQIIQ